MHVGIYGGALQLSDGGACPANAHDESGRCVADPTYSCKPKPSECGIPFDCACVASLCEGSYQCKGTTQHEVHCELDAP